MLSAKGNRNTVTDDEVNADLIHSERLFQSKIRCQMQHISRETLEKALDLELAAEDYHRQRSAIAALRAGVLFALLKVSMGQGYTGFWKYAEDRFKVNRSTISRKMRLAHQWYVENNINPAQALQLAECTDLDPAHRAAAPKAVQLAFDWIGDQTTTDLLRKYKLIDYGPDGAGGRREGPRPKGTSEEVAAESAVTVAGILSAQLDEFFAAKHYLKLDDLHLRQLNERLTEYQALTHRLVLDRGLRRLPADWRLTEHAEAAHV